MNDKGTRLSFVGKIVIAPDAHWRSPRFEADIDCSYMSAHAFTDWPQGTMAQLAEEISDAVGRAIAERALGLKK